MFTQKIQTVFSSGELDPELRARVDKPFYGQGCRTMLNFCPTAQGGACRRPGTRYLGKAMSENGRLIPFVFSASQGRMLEFGEKKMRVWMPDGSYVKKNGAVYEVATPFSLSDLRELSYAQSADVVYFAHGKHAPRKLERYGDDDWRWSTPTFEPTVEPPVISHVKMSGTSESTVSDREYRYQVVSVSEDDGSESNPSEPMSCSGKLLTTSYHPKIMWHAVEGASYYKVYKYRGGVYGFIGRCTEQAEEVTGLKINGVAATPLDLSMRTNIDDGGKFDISGGGYAWKTSDGLLLVFNTTKKRWYSIAEPKDGYTGVYPYSSAAAMDEALGSDEKAPVGTVGSDASAKTYATTTETLFVFADENIGADTGDTPIKYENPFDGEGNYPSQVFFFQQRLGFASTMNRPVTFWLSQSANFETFAAAVSPKDSDYIEVTLASTEANIISWCHPDRSVLAFGTESSEWVLQAAQGSVLTPSNCSFQQQSSIGADRMRAIGVGGGIVYLSRSSKSVRVFGYQYSYDKYVGEDLTILSRHMLRDVEIRSWAFQQEPYSILWCVTSDGGMIAMTYMQDQEVMGWHRHSTHGAFKEVSSIPGTPDDQVWFITKRKNGAFIERLETFFNSGDLDDAYFLDCAMAGDNAEPSTSFSGLTHLAGCDVKVFADGSTEDKLTVSASGKLEIKTGARHVVIGIPYTSTLIPNMHEVQDNLVDSMMHNKNLLHARLRVINSMTFNVGVDKLYPIVDRKVTEGTFPIRPFWSEATDLDCMLGAGWRSDCPITIEVDTPTPLTVLAILVAMDVARFSGRAS